MVKVVGGDKLEKALIEIGKRFSKSNKLKVGFLEDATYPDGTLVALVAATQNYGSPSKGIPPRPFLSNTIAAHKNEWPKELAKLLKGNKLLADKALEIMGEHIKGQIQQEIVKLTDPPLSPVTLMLRKMKFKNPTLKVTMSTVNEARRRVASGEGYAGVSTKPLIDTGHMLQSVDYAIE